MYGNEGSDTGAAIPHCLAAARNNQRLGTETLFEYQKVIAVN